MTTTTHAAGERIAGPEQAPAELLDVNAVGKLLGCSPRHVYRLSDAGKMPPPLRLGALVRWRRSAVLGWIDEGCPAVQSARRGLR